MRVRLSREKVRLLGALLLGTLAGGTFMAMPASAPAAATACAIPSAAIPVPAPSPPAPRVDPQDEPALTNREREVLARLARLPDLPVIQAPAFDIKGFEVTAHTRIAKSAAVAEPPAGGESVIARIQVLSIEKGRVFYRSVDEVLHTAGAGERLLGVNGHVVAVDERGAELQIDGRRMHVAANSL